MSTPTPNNLGVWPPQVPRANSVLPLPPEVQAELPKGEGVLWWGQTRMGPVKDNRIAAWFLGVVFGLPSLAVVVGQIKVMVSEHEPFSIGALLFPIISVVIAAPVVMAIRHVRLADSRYYIVTAGYLGIIYRRVDRRSSRLAATRPIHEVSHVSVMKTERDAGTIHIAGQTIEGKRWTMTFVDAEDPNGALHAIELARGNHMSASDHPDDAMR